MLRRYRLLTPLVLAALFLAQGNLSAGRPQGVRQQIEGLDWINGPREVTLFSIASIRVPQGYRLLEPAEAAKFMTLTQNLGGGNTYVLAPNDFHWWSELTFSREGYVKDDEKIDAPAILRTVIEGTDEGNKKRRANGWSTMSVVGWKMQPSYDTKTKSLEWAIRGKSDSDNSESINFNTRVLGRSGVTSATLIVDPEAFDAGVSEFKTALESYQYSNGEHYDQFKPGDKVAEYGLTALIVGGAAAVATKTGFWKMMGVALVAGWKVALGLAAALVAALRRMFKRKDA